MEGEPGWRPRAGLEGEMPRFEPGHRELPGGVSKKENESKR